MCQLQGVLRSTLVSGKQFATSSPHTGKYVINSYDFKVENFGGRKFLQECFAGMDFQKRS